MSVAPKLKYTAEQYLALEDKSLDKNEFYKGEIFAMAGASFEHNQIVSNSLSEIASHLKKSGKCQIFPSDLKIHSKTNTLYTYPDLSIVCNKAERLEGRNDIITNPSVLIEVLCASTQDYDRGGKFKLYRDLVSLKEYILISSLEILVEKYTKQDDSSWLLQTYTTNEVFAIQTIDLQMNVNELYRNVEFENGI